MTQILGQPCEFYLAVGSRAIGACLGPNGSSSERGADEPRFELERRLEQRGADGNDRFVGEAALAQVPVRPAQRLVANTDLGFGRIVASEKRYRLS